jgi:hypothetical protein
MSGESEVCWGVKGPWCEDHVFGPFESEEQVHAYPSLRRWRNTAMNGLVD